MLNKFYKYQSLGNDFILFDYYYKEHEMLNEIIKSKKWKPFIKKICERNFNIGANGVLILTRSILKDDSINKPIKQIPELLIYNSDGTQAEICLNGLRCATLHLREYHDISKTFKFKIGNKIIECLINQDKITTKIPDIIYKGSQTIKINNNEKVTTLNGHVLNSGNPHFVINQKINKEWLLKNGNKIESHKEFLNKTNVEFIWPRNDELEINTNLNVLVYERGVGYTLSCSSGATAITWLLYQQKKILLNQRINLFFEGGTLSCWIDKNKSVNLEAKADLIFNGYISS